MDAAVVSLSSELAGILALKEEQRTTPRYFPVEKMFLLDLRVLGYGSGTRQVSRFAATGSLEGSKKI